MRNNLIEKRLFDFAIRLISVSVMLALLTSGMNKKQAGAIGGRQTYTRHGRSHMQQIGKRGAATTWTRYQLSPVGLTEYAMVERATGKIICIKGR